MITIIVPVSNAKGKITNVVLKLDYDRFVKPFPIRRRIIDLLAAYPQGISVGDLAEQLGEPMCKTFSQVFALASQGFLQSTEHRGHYRNMKPAKIWKLRSIPPFSQAPTGTE